MRVVTRRAVRMVIVLGAVIVIAVQRLHHSAAPIASGPIASRPEESKPAAASADTLHFGKLSLRPCEIGRRGIGGTGTADAYCTDFDVPEDWDAATGRHIKLHVAIVKSGTAHSHSDLVTYLAGGPGGAATEEYPALAPALSLLKQRRDILLIDQRGTGGSNALSCPAPAEKTQPIATDMADSRAQLQKCLETVQTHAAPEHYTTTDAAHDLEAVRQALGSPQLNLYGVSYGTRMAQQYAARYPASVRSVVLDSVVPNSLVLGSEHAHNLEQALHALFAVCSADERCQKNFGDTYATLYRLRDRLQAHPEKLSLRDPNNFQPLQLELTAQDLAAIVRFYAYSPVTAALLPLMLHEADQGNYAPLLSQKKLLNDSLGTEISGGMELSVICTEDADLLTPQPEQTKTLMGDAFQTRLQGACSLWPKGQRPANFHSPWVSTLPVLILSGQYDPVTPPAYGAQVLQTLPHGRQLIAAGQGHAVLAAGCMPRLINQFVDQLNAAALDATCLQALGDTPAFVDFNGAPP